MAGLRQVTAGYDRFYFAEFAVFVLRVRPLVGGRRRKGEGHSVWEGGC